MRLDSRELAGHARAIAEIGGSDNGAAHIRITDGQLTLSATRAGRSVIGTMPAIGYEGEQVDLMVDAAMLAKASAQFDDEVTATLADDNGRLVLEEGWTHHELVIYASEETDKHSVVPFDDDAVVAEVRLDTDTAKAAHSLKAICAGDDAKMQTTRGFILTVGEDGAAVTATDGQRITHARLLQAAKRGAAQVSLDATAMALAEKMAEDSDHVRIEIGSGSDDGGPVVRLSNGSRTVISPTIAGKYPRKFAALEGVLPEPGATISSTADRIKASVSRVTDIVPKDNDVDLTSTDGALTIETARKADIGRSRTRLSQEDGSQVQGNGTAKLRSSFLGDAVKVLPKGAENVDLTIYGDGRGGVKQPLRVSAANEKVAVTSLVMQRM